MASRPDPRVTTLLNQQAAVSQGLFDRIVTLIRRLFGAAGPSDWYSEEWVTTTADQLSRSSRTVQVAQANTTGRVLDLVAQQYGKPTTGRVTLPDNLRQGVTPEDVWRRPAEQYRYAASQGAEPAQALKVATQRAVALADTDRQLADRWAAREKLQLPEITGYRRIIHPELSVSGVCGLCVVAADRIYHVEELRAIHENCVPPWAVVAAKDVSAITRRDYSGELVVIGTAAGEQFSVTPNHPVLTEDGWVPAGFVKAGDNVVRHGVGHGVVGRSPDEHQQPVTAEDVWRTATVDRGLHTCSVPLAAEDFHGDGSDGEVEVVSTNGLFSHVGDVSFAQPLGHGPLVAGHGFGAGFPSQGGLFQATLDGWLATNGGVGRNRDLLALLASGLDVPEFCGLAGPPALYSALGEPLLYGGSGNAVFGSQSLFAGSTQVLADDFRGGQGVPAATRFDPAGFEYAAEGRSAYASLGRSLLDRLAGDVELHRVVHIERVAYTGHVFNLHTAEGWYSSDDHIVSNCKCTTLPIYEDNDPGLSLNQQDLAEIYRAAGSTGAADLKRVRMKVEEHGELGPVLRVQGQKFRDKEDVADDRTRIDEAERTLADLLARQAAGEALEPQIAYQRRLITRLGKKKP